MPKRIAYREEAVQHHVKEGRLSISRMVEVGKARCASDFTGASCCYIIGKYWLVSLLGGLAALPADEYKGQASEGSTCRADGGLCVHVRRGHRLIAFIRSCHIREARHERLLVGVYTVCQGIVGGLVVLV